MFDLLYYIYINYTVITHHYNTLYNIILYIVIKYIVIINFCNIYIYIYNQCLHYIVMNRYLLYIFDKLSKVNKSY